MYASVNVTRLVLLLSKCERIIERKDMKRMEWRRSSILFAIRTLVGAREFAQSEPLDRNERHRVERKSGRATSARRSRGGQRGSVPAAGADVEAKAERGGVEVGAGVESRSSSNGNWALEPGPGLHRLAEEVEAAWAEGPASDR